MPPWSLIRGSLLTLVLPAFTASALVMTVVCVLAKSPRVRMAGAALALIAGLAAGNYFSDLAEWWPRETAADDVQPAPWWALARGWAALLPVTAAALVAGMSAAILSRRAGVLLRMLATAGVAWWHAEALPPFSKTLTFAMLFAGMVLNHEALLFTAKRTLHRTSLLTLSIPWGATAATVLIFAHSARFSDLAALMTVSLCGAGLIAALWKAEPTALFAGPAAFFPPLMLAGAVNTYSEVPAAAFACTAFAPCALWLLRLPPLQRLPARALAAAAVVAVLIPCAAAVAMAVWTEDLDFGE